MSSASRNYHQSLDVEKEKKCVTWLGTAYFEKIPFNVENMTTSIIWRNQRCNFAYVGISLEFQLSRHSDLEFRLTCFQTRPAPQRYTLRLHCSMNIFQDSPKVFQMQSDQHITFQQLYLDACYREHISTNEFNENLELKISVEMIEYDCSSNRWRRIQEDQLQVFRKRFFNDEAVVSDLCYILNIPQLKDIFTGRQNAQFFVQKINFIRRAATFSKEIADYLKARETRISLPLTDLSTIFNYILNFERGPVSNKVDIFKLYCEALALDLNFLVILSRDMILATIENDPDFLNRALLHTDRVCDEFLFDKVAERFHYFERLKGDPDGWLERFKSNDVKIRFTARSLKRRMKKIESAGREEVAEASSSEEK